MLPLLALVTRCQLHEPPPSNASCAYVQGVPCALSNPSYSNLIGKCINTISHHLRILPPSIRRFGGRYRDRDRDRGGNGDRDGGSSICSSMSSSSAYNSSYTSSPAKIQSPSGSGGDAEGNYHHNCSVKSFTQRRIY